jgi:hypothetical protein
MMGNGKVVKRILHKDALALFLKHTRSKGLIMIFFWNPKKWLVQSYQMEPKAKGMQQVFSHLEKANMRQI